VQSNQVAVRILVITIGLYAVGTHLHAFIRQALVEPNFLDTAYYYVWGDLLRKGIDIYLVQPFDSKTLEFLSTPAGLPIPHLSHRPFLSFINTGVLIYSPAFISLVSLLSLMAFKPACIVWTLFNYGALVLSILLILRTLDLKLDAVTLSLVSFMVFSFQPLLECTALGQSNLILLSMLSLSLWATKNEKPYWAGLFLSFAIHIKPQFALLVLLFPLKGMYRHLTSTIICYILIVVVSLPITGFHLQLGYFRALFRTAAYAQEATMLEWGKNLSLLSAVTRLLGSSYIGELRLLNAVFAVGILAYSFRKFRMPYNVSLFVQEFAYMTALVLVLVPVFEEHYLVLLYLPILCLFSQLPYMNRLWRSVFVVGFLLVGLKYSLVSFPAFSSGFLSLFSNGKLYGLIAITVCTFFCWKHGSEELDRHFSKTNNIMSCNQSNNSD
jgi:hypothetical protein